MFWKKSQKVNNLTLENLELKMNERNFDEDFIQVILNLFKRRMEAEGEKHFQIWLSNLHFRVSEEFQEEQTAIKLSWEVQSEDMKSMNDYARKAIVVIRHRVSEVVLDIVN